MLTDDQMNPRSIPTRMNMVNRSFSLSCVYAPYLRMHPSFRSMPSSGLYGMRSPMIRSSCIVCRTATVVYSRS